VISSAHKRFLAVTIRRIYCDTGAHGYRWAIVILSQPIVNSVGNLTGSLCVGLGKDHGELIATETRDRVDGTARPSQSIRHPAECLVAGHVAELIVDDF
jgi:hypothetical protein